MNENTCSVIGCGKPATAFLQLTVPLDDGTTCPITLPQLFCEDCRGDVKAKVGELKDEVWNQIQKLLPEGRVGVREKVDIKTLDMISPLPPPPEIDAAFGRFMMAEQAFLEMRGGGPVRGHAATEWATRSERLGQLFRNYPGQAEPERRTAAEAFDDLARVVRKIGKHLGRNEIDGAEKLAQDMMSKRWRCRVLSAVATTAMAAPTATTA